MTKGRNTAGSGGRIRKSLAGRGPTPKAEDREYHRAHKAKKFRERQEAKRGTKAKGTGEWVVGRNAVLEALQAGLPIKTAYVAESVERDDRLREIFKYAASHSVPLLQATKTELDRLTGGAVHQGVALLLTNYVYAELPDLIEQALEVDGIIVACDQITDPHNLGAIIRSAAAFAASGVVIPARRSAKVTAATWKASAGAAARLPIAQVVNLNRALEDLAEAGLTILGLAGEAETTLAEVNHDRPLVLVVGSESDGLARLVRDHCDALIRIPISNAVESLNASVATAITLHDLTAL